MDSKKLKFDEKNACEDVIKIWWKLDNMWNHTNQYVKET
jgi:hypothetical protein